MNTEQAVTDLADVIDFHVRYPFQSLKLTADELEAVFKLAMFAETSGK